MGSPLVVLVEVLQCSRGSVASEIDGELVRKIDGRGQLQCSRGSVASEILVDRNGRAPTRELQCSRGSVASEIRRDAGRSAADIEASM